MTKKLIVPALLLALAIAFLSPLCVQAITPLDPSADASLTLYYQKDQAAFPDLPIEIYRVAEPYPDGSFHLIEPYASYPVNIHDITKQEHWKHIVVTLSSYIAADSLFPDRTGITDSSGKVSFEDLETGLYLVNEVSCENDSGSYVFNRFMVYVPTPHEDGSYTYNVEARPKCISFVPNDEYRVTKLWQDKSNAGDRPKEVTVDVYKNGELYNTAKLNADNSWTYSWKVSSEDRSEWTVAERTVPENYTVSIQQNGNSFSVINTHKSNLEIPDSPQTGETFAILPFVLITCFMGLAALMIGIYRRGRG